MSRPEAHNPDEPARETVALGAARLAALEELDAALANRLLASVRVGRALAEIERLEAHRIGGAGSVELCAERHGLSGWETRELLDLVRGFDAVKGLEELTCAGKIPVPSAARIGGLTRVAELRDDEVFLARALYQAQILSARRFKRWCEGEQDRRTKNTPMVHRTLVIPRDQDCILDRVWNMARRKTKSNLSLGMAILYACSRWLEQVDPLFATKGTGTRRMPDTGNGQVPGRTLPAEVEQELVERHGDRCPLPFCDNEAWLENAHSIPHAVGGSRESRNMIGRPCHSCHTLFDVGLVKNVGSAEAPIFTDAEGRKLDGRPGWKVALRLQRRWDYDWPPKAPPSRGSSPPTAPPASTS